MNRILRLALLSALAASTAVSAQPAPDPPITIDSHVDIPFNYMGEPRFDVGHDTRLLVDLGKMERGGLNAAFFVIWVPQHELDAAGYAKAVQQATQKYDGISHMLMQYPDRIRLATTPEQLRANHKAGLLSATIEIENAYSLGHDIHRLDAAYDRGVRSVGLVHVGTGTEATTSECSYVMDDGNHASVMLRWSLTGLVLGIQQTWVKPPFEAASVPV